MSTIQQQRPTWDAIAQRLADVRSLARAERKARGAMSPETARLMKAALDDAAAWVAADDAIERARSGS